MNDRTSHYVHIDDAFREKMDQLVERYNCDQFITNDPMQVPKSFQKRQDVEIAAFITATLGWGLRKTIINKSFELMERMDNAPHDFILNHTPKDLKALESFKHRTFNATDLLYFVDFLQRHYTEYDSLETAFTLGMQAKESTLKDGLIHFHNYFFDAEHAPRRTRKHVATPERKSACKRLNMMMRWLVRKDHTGVDLGIWSEIKMSQLYIPLDVHVDRIARRWNILTRKPTDWQAVEEVTAFCRALDPEDPGKYDFALFGIGLEEKQGYF